MTDKRAKNRKKMQSLLRDLFQFDHADLDFGIYRIMNEKREDVEHFIEEDLLDAVDEALSHFQTADRDELQKQLAEKRAQLGDAAFDETGAVHPQFRDMPIAREYEEVRKKLRQMAVAEETEARVFNDLWRFFSRYYDQGDFLTERRYSSRGAKYCIPYNGEELMLHWANRDQYYVKSSERFTDYRFGVGDYVVWFRLQQAEVLQDNVKGDKRYFVLHEEQPPTYNDQSQTLTIPFAYRPIAEDEEAHYLGVYNEQQSKSDRRKTLDRSVLCVALETKILEQLDLPDLKAALAAVPEGKDVSALGRHLNRYTARHTMDYFVHKDLGSFLRHELDVFLKTEVMNLDDVMGDKSGEMAQHVLTRMRVVRQIANRIIDFLAQIEDFQKRLFEKQKFVIQTDYCITLDQVPEDFYPDIIANEAQLDEWRRIYQISDWDSSLFWRGSFDEAFLTHHPYLMIDTAFFDEGFKAQLLATFDHLDDSVDGLLIHGENLQSLNLLMEKYRGQVKCIYIDPPYNTGNDEFLYKDNYQHSSWLSMIDQRLEIAHNLMVEEGLFFSSIDDHELTRMRLLLEQQGRTRAFLGPVIVQVNRGGRSYLPIAKMHEYLICAAVNSDHPEVNELPVKRDYRCSDSRGSWKPRELRNRNPRFMKDNRPNLYYPFYVDPETTDKDGYCAVSLTPTEQHVIEVYPKNQDDEDDCWRWGKEKCKENINATSADQSNVVARKTRGGKWNIYEKYRKTTTKAKSIWEESAVRTENGTIQLGNLFGESVYTHPKPVELIEKCLTIGSNPGDLILDFFAGSGTTAQAVMGLNREQDGGDRKYILVEMADYFDTVLKPRVLKVAFSSNWKGGVPQDRDGMSHMVKYHRIESYEDTLNNICVRRPKGSQLELLRQFDDYMLHYMLDFETRDSPALLAWEAFDRPFDYTLKIQQGHESPNDTAVDLLETFHYLIGMHVRRLERYEHQDRTYVVSRGEVRTEHGIERVATVWRDTEGLDREEEAWWMNEEVLTDPVDRVYVNGPSFIDKAEPLEIVFRSRMERGIDGTY